MPWRYNGRMHVDSNAPRASGVCDRCNIVYALSELKFQYQWRGTSLSNTGFRVCYICYDVPSVFLKALQIPADPLPVAFPRPNQFEMQMNATQLAHWDISTDTPDSITIILGTWDSGGSVWP